MKTCYIHTVHTFVHVRAMQFAVAGARVCAFANHVAGNYDCVLKHILVPRSDVFVNISSHIVYIYLYCGEKWLK